MSQVATTAAPSADAAPTTATADADDKFAAVPCEYAVEKRPDGTFAVQDVPIFGENDRKSFMDDTKYDAGWLKGAAKVDEGLRAEKYSAPMHFGHHTFSGASVERAGHYELTGVRKAKLHGKKLHVAFANLVFKNEAAFERYRSDYPYRSVEISHERPDQINSLALLSSEAPYFQFPMGNLKFGTEVGAEPPKAHYFAWQGEGVETFAGFPPKKGATKASQPPKYSDDEDPEAAGESDGADGMADAANGAPPPAPGQDAAGGTNQNDVVVATLNAMMELLNKLVDATLKRSEGAAAPPATEPDGADDAPSNDETDDGDEPMADKDEKKKTPVVAASADVATMQGTIVAMQAKIDQMERERANDALFATLMVELGSCGIPNLADELRKQIAAGTAQAWATGVKQVAPSRRASEAPSQPVEDPALVEFLKKNPKADAMQVRRLAAVYASAEGVPGGDLIRKYPLDRFLAVQLEMGN